MKKSKKVFFVLTVIGAMFWSTGCGNKTRSRTSTLARGDSATIPTGPIPSNGSVSAANGSLIGSWAYEGSGCRAGDGSFVPYPVSSAGDERLVITENRLTSVVDYPWGCRVESRFAILGIDSQNLVIGDRQIQVSFEGAPDTDGECADVTPGMSGPNWYFTYRTTGYQLSLLWPASEPCEAGEMSEDVYRKL